VKTLRFLFNLLLMGLLWMITIVGTQAIPTPNLVVNGSFEDGLNNWDTTSPFPAPGGVVIVHSGSGLNTPDGNSFAYVPGYGLDNYGDLSQTILTMPGNSYDLSFFAVALNGSSQDSVSINKQLLATFNLTSGIYPGGAFLYDGTPLTYLNTNWQKFDYAFQATSASTILSFDLVNEIIEVPGQGGPDWYSGNSGIDAISVMQVPDAVSTFLLLLISVVSLFLFRRTNAAWFKT
jgi:hypothetical protein